MRALLGGVRLVTKRAGLPDLSVVFPQQGA
jgi:hypothetical protein